MKRNLLPVRRIAGICLAVTLVGGMTTPAVAASTVDIIVRAPGRGSGAAASAVRSVHGDVTYQLPIVDGVAATVPISGVSWLQSSGFDVADDAPVKVFASDWSSGPSTARSEIGVDRLDAAGVDGTPDRTVALIDTGVTTAGIPDLTGKLVPITDDLTGPVSGPQQCLDLSGEGTCDDAFGHGTFLAGLIAGSGAASGGRYRGIAPGTRIVSIKIAGVDGSSDVSKVIAALQFVVSFKDKYGIKVVNLSLGTDSKQDWRTDPLNLAVERAWDAGITAVVAAGNLGPVAGSVTKPGDDPLVITVGASDDRGTPAISDDSVPRFSGRGLPGQGKPDVVAPGTRLTSVLPAGSTIENRLQASGSPAIAPGYRQASGTSMSAAVTSGSAALLAELHPEWTPGQVKAALEATTNAIGVSDPLLVGAGQIDVYRASGLTAPGDADAGVGRSDGTGSLQDSRGTLIVTATCYGLRAYVDPFCGRKIEGQTTAGGRTFQSNDLLGTSWYTSQWYGTSWYGTSWYGTSWYSTDASQGTTKDSGSDGEILGIGPPGSRLYGLWQ